MIHSSLTVVRRFDNGYMRKQPVVWKDYCAEHWLKNSREVWIGALAYVTEILLKTALNTIQSFTAG